MNMQIAMIHCEIEDNLKGFLKESHLCVFMQLNDYHILNPTALRKAKTAYNFGLSKCNRVKVFWRLVLTGSIFAMH